MTRADERWALWISMWEHVGLRYFGDALAHARRSVEQWNSWLALASAHDRVLERQRQREHDAAAAVEAEHLRQRRDAERLRNKRVSEAERRKSAIAERRARQWLKAHAAPVPGSVAVERPGFSEETSAVGLRRSRLDEIIACEHSKMPANITNESEDDINGCGWIARRRAG